MILQHKNFKGVFWGEKELMVQRQTFTTSDYLLKNNCFDNSSLQNRKKKWGKII